jgi:hypothetical protein
MDMAAFALDWGFDVFVSEVTRPEKARHWLRTRA